MRHLKAYFYEFVIFQVIFLNEKTKEFLFYIITLKIVPLESSIENIELSTCVRVPVVTKITIKNPLPESVDYTVTTSSPYIIVPNSFMTLPYEKVNNLFNFQNMNNIEYPFL